MNVTPPKDGVAGRPLLRLELTGMGRLGEALARWDDRWVFVFGSIPGERVMAETLRERRRRVVARVAEVLEASPHRVSPPCPYFGECTGCQWQHIDYSYQLALKHTSVVDAFERVGGLPQAPIEEVLPAPEQYGYRNHARFTVGPQGNLGFVHRETRRFVAVERCLLMHPWINEALTQLQGRCGETTQLSIRYGVNTGEYLIQPTLKNPEVPLETGQKHYSESLMGWRFRIASPSFFQVNTHQAERVVRLLKEVLELDGRGLLVDAYAGVGTFAVLLAPHVEHVVGVEDSPAAVEDAKANASGVENISFILGKTEEALAHLERRPDAVILDPPRKGCHPAALEALKTIGPARVAYVSCDPATLARDLKSLCSDGFHLARVQPVDMFPQTHHVECIALLTRVHS